MSKYANLLNNITENQEEAHDELNDHVLLIDSMNMFIRSFSAINTINNQGNHIGGLVGYLKSIAYVTNTIKPTRLIAVFDGEGNVTNKKYLYPEYKGTRKIKRITNWSAFDTLQEESESIATQLLRLIDYLKTLPLSIIIVDKLEADDVIGYLAKKFKHTTIVSADQDFLQLVSDSITVFSPIKRKFYTPVDIYEEYGLWPQNFINMKVLLGDKSDNVPKVTGLGEGKLFKLFPELRLPEKITLDDIINKSLDKASEAGLYGNIYNFRKQLGINFKLMDLETPNIPEQEILRLNRLVDEKPYKMNTTKFINYYNEDKLGKSIKDVNYWLSENFSYLNNIK